MATAAHTVMRRGYLDWFLRNESEHFSPAFADIIPSLKPSVISSSLRSEGLVLEFTSELAPDAIWFCPLREGQLIPGAMGFDD